jgi:hypothetical protein
MSEGDQRHCRRLAEIRDLLVRLDGALQDQSAVADERLAEYWADTQLRVKHLAAQLTWRLSVGQRSGTMRCH